MHRNTKIATCCYCNARTTLVLGRDRHELACASCGAPLHALKSVPVQPAPAPKKSHKTYGGGGSDGRGQRPSKSHSKPKKRKSLWRRMASEAFDVLEDIVEEVFD